MFRIFIFSSLAALILSAIIYPIVIWAYKKYPTQSRQFSTELYLLTAAYVLITLGMQLCIAYYKWRPNNGVFITFLSGYTLLSGLWVAHHHIINKQQLLKLLAIAFLSNIAYTSLVFFLQIEQALQAFT